MLQIAVCDNEKDLTAELAEQIAAMLNRQGIEVRIQCFYDGEALLNAKETFAAVFLDIMMDGIDGMETAKKLRSRNISSDIVFITALKEYVFEAFEVDAVNYLVKPVNPMKLSETLAKIVKRKFHEMGQGDQPEHLLLREGTKLRTLEFDDLMYCEARDHLVYLYLNKDRGIEVYHGKIDELNSLLNQCFFRCHRSYIVNLKYVLNCEGDFAQLTGGEKIPLARRRKKEFYEALVQYHRREVR